MRYACIRTHEGAFTVTLMCRVLAVSRAGYYAWRGRKPSARAQADLQLRVAIRAIHAASRRRYGSPRIHRELRAQQWRCGRKRVARLMRVDRLRGKRSQRYRSTTQADGTPPAPNHLQRRFRIQALNRVWASDVTACRTDQGWLYVAVVLDLASRRVIGWAAGPSTGQELTLPALRHALRCLQLSEQNGDEQTAFDRATAYGCAARANACAGRHEEVERLQRLALEAAQSFEQPEEKEVFERLYPRLPA